MLNLKSGRGDPAADQAYADCEARWTRLKQLKEDNETAWRESCTALDAATLAFNKKTAPYAHWAGEFWRLALFFGLIGGVFAVWMFAASIALKCSPGTNQATEWSAARPG